MIVLRLRDTLMCNVVVLIVVAVHKGLLWSIKVYLIIIEAITVVELASRPCLDLAFTLPNPLLDLAMNLP